MRRPKRVFGLVLCLIIVPIWIVAVIVANTLPKNVHVSDGLIIGFMGATVLLPIVGGVLVSLDEKEHKKKQALEASRQAAPAAANVSQAVAGGYSEKDNAGIRQSTFDQAVAYWSTRNMRQKFDPFILYSFDSEEDARKALLELNCIFEAKESANLICTEPFNFGYYRVDGGQFEAIIAGERLSYELWEKAKASFEKHGGRRKNDQEPEKKEAPAPAKPENPAAKVRFIRKITNAGGIYEEYECGDAECAKEFLMTKSVDKQQYYIVVQTPMGVWGTDIKGLYKEHLLPWQSDISPVETVGHTTGMPDMFSLQMAARRINDNFMVGVECGKCGHHWMEGVRYQAWTAVQCPGCGTKNKVDSYQYNVVLG